MTARALADRPYRKGVGALIINVSGLVFVARRIDAPVEAWQLPQGGIKSGERPRAAVLREVAEEIGTDKVEILAKSRRWHRYELPAEIADRVWQGQYQGQKQRWFAMRFLGADRDIDLAASAKPEFDAWRWVDIRELPSLAISFKHRLYLDIVEEFAGIVAALRCDGEARA